MSLNKALQIILLVCLLATMVTCIKAGGVGNLHKKIIIHVPFKVKHHHHTHTIYKHIHHGAHGAHGAAASSAHNGDDYYEVLGYSYGSPHKGAAPVASEHAPSYTSFGGGSPMFDPASVPDHSAGYTAFTGYEDDAFGGSHSTFTTHSSFSGEEHEQFSPYTGNDLGSLSPYEGEIRARKGFH